MLARTLEAQGLSTVLVTNMPFWAERIGVPRTLAVEFPFGHLLGQSGNPEQQMRVIRQALDILEHAEAPGKIVDSPEQWPVSQEEATANWQPKEPSPLIQTMGPQIRAMLRAQRLKARER